jgi:ABC-type phosphate/phosphonate transport system substrate-binding protein
MLQIKRLVLLALPLTLFFHQPAMAAGSMLLGINEGLAEQSDFKEMQEKYQGFANVLSGQLQKRVLIESSQNLKEVMAMLAKGRYDIMFCRPSNLAAKAIRDDRYSLIAMADGALAAVFIVNKNSPLKKPEDISSKRFAMPEKTALVTKVGLATFRDMNIDPAKQNIHYAHYQDAISFMVKNNFADVGVVAPAIANTWEKSGGKTLFRSKTVPFWAVIASPSVSQADVAKVRAALLELGKTEEGQKVLKRIGVKNFVAGNPKDYIDMLTWLGS